MGGWTGLMLCSAATSRTPTWPSLRTRRRLTRSTPTSPSPPGETGLTPGGWAPLTCTTREAGSGCRETHGVFENWNEGEPNQNGNEDCGAFDSQAGYKWMDLECNSENHGVPHYALCERLVG